MSASDDEFEQYLNELNDIVETPPVDYPDYLDPSINEVSWLPWIHEWPSSLVLSAFDYCLTQFHHPACYILLPPPDSIPNHHVAPNSQRFWPC